MINLKDFLPLREPTFYILLSLSSEKKHGYAVMQDVNCLSKGKLELSNGTLYGALTRLQDQGLIKRVSSSQPNTPGKPRKAYELTRDGQKVLQAEIKRLDALVQTARQHLPEGV